MSKQQYSRLTVKSLKSCLGNEGYAYSATLYFDGKRVGEVRDDGNGGEPFVHFFKKVGGKIVRDEEAKKRVLAYVEEQPEVDMGPHPADRSKTWMLKPDLSWVVGQVVDQALEEAQFKKWCRTKVCFRLKGDEEGTWRTIKANFKKEGARVKAHLVKEYGDRIEEILNERFAA